jgi:hypothetical protein
VSGPAITKRTRALARFSENCLVCQRARRRQAGFALWVVKTFEGLCPFCRAYEKVFGRKSHEPVSSIPGREGRASSPAQVRGDHQRSLG